jgi:hypothetical protein
MSFIVRNAKNINVQKAGSVPAYKRTRCHNLIPGISL